MAGNSIKYTKNLKYLGVIFDSKLTWIHHLNSIQDKINSLQHKIYRISRATWGLNPRVKKEIHNKVTEKIISYGHEIWYQDKTKQNIKILKLQRSGLLNITKCYKTVSTDALQVLAGIPPLDLKLKFSSILFRLKIGNQPATIQNFLIQPQSFNYKKPIIPPWTKTAFSWKYYNSSNITAGILIYTDGSKMNNKVGGAIVAFEDGVEMFSHGFRLSDHETVFSAERMAIETAIDFIVHNNIQVSSIISDSRSVLQALENPNNIDTNIIKIKDKISSCNGTIHLFWIKAHEGFAGNEKADEYAKVATRKDQIDITSTYDINFIKKLIKKEIVAAWQDRWSNSSKGREVFTLFPEVKISRIQGDFLINQLITGHGCLGVYQERFFGGSGTCPCGHPSEDRIHIIFDCPQWNNYREKSFPRNHLEVKMELLLFNKISRAGLRDIMALKLQAALQSTNDK
ncbi:putative 115 kDa protein in type-1 retrotransposable element R1DM [Caerostris darwini]|uniref:115 kDa protein in type-1 retrotransposable element R1DM n=1 Tax=Caerostris darwini TaxID=1538125 RepID=A0AAV4NFL7_9ARAC|nr:putative 115 kDa protein in type-1 retrotransposable element R1DM [Caerostris darwini]